MMATTMQKKYKRPTKKEAVDELWYNCAHFGRKFSPEELERMRSEALAQTKTPKARGIVNEFFDVAKVTSENIIKMQR